MSHDHIAPGAPVHRRAWRPRECPTSDRVRNFFIWKKSAANTQLHTQVSFPHFAQGLFKSRRVLRMRAHSLLRAQSLPAGCLRQNVRAISRTPPRCSISMAATQRTWSANGSSIGNFLKQGNSCQQRRWQSVAAAV